MDAGCTGVMNPRTPMFGLISRASRAQLDQVVTALPTVS